MFWVDPKYRSSLDVAPLEGYDTLAQLAPSGDFVEKQGRSTGRYILGPAERPLSVYLKKYLRMPWWHCWLRPISDFPGPRELANLRRAAALGIRVAEPIVAGADRRHRCKSLLAVRELVGYLPLHRYIPARFSQPDTRENRQIRRTLTLRLASIAQRLHAARLYHCDFYLCHFFIRETPAEPTKFDLVLIDLMRLRQSRLPRWRVKDLAQLLFSTDLPAITRTDRMRFFKNYLGLSRLDEPARQLLRRVQRKAAQYHRHNAAA